MFEARGQNDLHVGFFENPDLTANPGDSRYAAAAAAYEARFSSCLYVYLLN